MVCLTISFYPRFLDGVIKNIISCNMQHRHILCFLFMRGLATIFLVGGFGVEEKKRERAPRTPDRTERDFYFSGALEQTASLQIEIKNTSWTEATKCRHLCLYNQLFALFHYVFKFLTL